MEITVEDRIVYAGMHYDRVYSIAQRKAFNNQGYSWNLFFSKNRRDIIIDDAGIYVERVTPNEIEFRVSQDGSDAAGICL